MAGSEISKRLGELQIDRNKGTARPRRRRWIALLTVGGVALLATGLLLLRRPPVVSVAQVRQARVGEQQTQLTAAGYVASRRRSIVAPKVSGRLDALLVEEGQRVEKGEVIARLDPEDAKIALQQAAAEARAAQGALAVAEAERARTRREFDRARDLSQAGAVARQAFDEAQSAFEAASAQTEAARSRSPRRGTRCPPPAWAWSTPSSALRSPARSFASSRTRARCSRRPPSIGRNIGGIIELVDLGQLEVEAEVSEDQLARVRSTEPALIFLDAWPRPVSTGGGHGPSRHESVEGHGVVKVRLPEPQPRGVYPDMAARVSFLSRPRRTRRRSRGSAAAGARRRRWSSATGGPSCSPWTTAGSSRRGPGGRPRRQRGRASRGPPRRERGSSRRPAGSWVRGRGCGSRRARDEHSQPARAGSAR